MKPRCQIFAFLIILLAVATLRAADGPNFIVINIDDLGCARSPAPAV